MSIRLKRERELAHGRWETYTAESESVEFALLIVEHLAAADQQDLLAALDLELALDAIGERAHVLDAIGQVEYVPRARVHSAHVYHLLYLIIHPKNDM